MRHQQDLIDIVAEHQALAYGLAACGIGLLIAIGMVVLNQRHLETNQTTINSDQRRIVVLQLQVTQLERKETAGQADTARQQQLIRALQQQLRRLGATPVALPPSPGSGPAAGGQPEPGRSPAPRSTSSSSRPQPTPTPTRSGHPSPSPSPTPQPSICYGPVCI